MTYLKDNINYFSLFEIMIFINFTGFKIAEWYSFVFKIKIHKIFMIELYMIICTCFLLNLNIDRMTQKACGSHVG